MNLKRVVPLLLLLAALVPLSGVPINRAPSGVEAASLRAAPRTLISLERSVQQIRHLKQIRSVKASFLPDKDFETTYQSIAHRDTPQAEIAFSQREYVLLGLLKKSDDLNRILFQKLGPQVGGLYDNKRKVLFVRNHGNEALGVRRDLIAHEYTHALQDQHYNLRKLTPDELQLKYRNTDVVGAHKALIEGDAVNTQYLFISRTYTRQDLSQFFYLQAHPPKTPPLPKSIQRVFDFQYVAGLAFVQRLYQRGGARAVDSAFRHLPNSTYVIMHPGTYLSHWKPVSVPIHRAQGFEQWKQVDDDVFGAFGYNLLLWQYLPKKVADRITDSYRGDRYIFLENGSQDAMLLRSAWTSTKAARAARDALIAALGFRYRHHLRSAGGAAPTTFLDPDGAVYLKVAGKQLTGAYAPTAALAQQLGTAVTG